MSDYGNMGKTGKSNSAALMGNKNAKKKRRPVGDELRLIAKQNPEKLRAACMKVLDQAVAGDLACFHEIADRLDGRVAPAMPDSGGAGYIERIERVVFGFDIQPDDDEKPPIEAEYPDEFTRIEREPFTKESEH